MKEMQISLTCTPSGEFQLKLMRIFQLSDENTLK